METNGDQPQSKSAVTRPATIAMRVHFPQASIAIRPNLWHQWALLAMKAEARTVAAFRDGQGADDIAPYAEAMTMETMIAVTAVRSSFRHLYIDRNVPQGLRPEGDERKVPKRATTDIPTDSAERKAWLGAISKVVEDRDMIIRKAQDSQEVVPHPLGGNTSALDGYFVSDRAREAADVMLDFYRKAITSPTPAMREWAEKRGHVPKQLGDIRQRYHDDEATS